nr:hypothetical protein GCM10020063_023850 [Dactylosporangium thailandense]
MKFWWLVAVGAATVVFGAAVLAWPHATLRLLGILAGLWLLLIGLLRIAGALRAPDPPRRARVQRIVDGFFGILLVVLAIASLTSARAGVLTVSALIGLAWLIIGFGAVLLGVAAAGRTRAWLCGLGGVAILLGLAFVTWPGLSLRVLVLLTGISAVALGAAEITIAVQARRRA